MTTVSPAYRNRTHDCWLRVPPGELVTVRCLLAILNGRAPYATVASWIGPKPCPIPRSALHVERTTGDSARHFLRLFSRRVGQVLGGRRDLDLPLQAGHISSRRESFERYALSPIAAGSRWPLLLQSPLLSSARCVRAWPPSPPAAFLVRRPFPHRTDCCRPIRRREGGPRVVSRVRQPGTFTCARCPAVTAALDAVPEAYHNPAAVWWGPLQLPRSSGIRWSCRPGRRSPRSTAPVTGSPPGRCMAYGRQGRMATVCRRFHVISTCSSPGPQMGVVACSDGPPGPRYWPVLTEEEL